MPEILSGLVVLDPEILSSPYLTPWQIFRVRLTQLMESMEAKAEERDMEILPSSWHAEGGAFGGGAYGGTPVIRVRATAVPYRVTDAEVDAAMAVLEVEFGLPFVPPYGEYQASVRRAVRRALTAARNAAAAQLRKNARGVLSGAGQMSIKPDLSKGVKGIDRDALAKLELLADVDLTVEGRLWGPGEGLG